MTFLGFPVNKKPILKILTEEFTILWWGWEDGTTAYVISGRFGKEKSEELK